MSRNFTLEAQLKEAARAAGALQSALPDFEGDVQIFAITTAEEIPAWIERCKKERPHRFAVQGDHDAELARKAFVGHHKTSEGLLFRAVGKERFEELKAIYANGVPESEQKRTGADHSKNPWAPIESNINLKTGRYTEAAVKRQFSTVRALGVQKAAEIAAGVGAKPGDIFAPGFKNRAA